MKKKEEVSEGGRSRKAFQKVGGACLDLSLSMFELLLATVCFDATCCCGRRRVEGRCDHLLDKL